MAPKGNIPQITNSASGQCIRRTNIVANPSAHTELPQIRITINAYVHIYTYVEREGEIQIRLTYVEYNDIEYCLLPFTYIEYIRQKIEVGRYVF